MLFESGHENVVTRTQCTPHAKRRLIVAREDWVTCTGFLLVLVLVFPPLKAQKDENENE
jgi:hypothetical protein